MSETNEKKLRNNTCGAMLSHATQMSLRDSGQVQAAKLYQEITTFIPTLVTVNIKKYTRSYKHLKNNTKTIYFLALWYNANFESLLLPRCTAGKDYERDTCSKKKKIHKRNAQYNRNHLVLKEGVPTYLLGPVDFSLLGFHAIGYSLRSMYILIFVNRSPVDCSQTTVLYTND